MRKTCLDMVHTLAKRDDRVVFIGSDLSPGLLSNMKKEFPDRYYMEGIAEGNAVGMAAGMAMEGFVPYVNTIATFLTRRCYEQVAVDLCVHNLPVRLIANGGGLVYAPLGPTHEAIEDIAIMRALPNLTVVAPADADEMARLMEATLDWPGPIYIRMAKGGDRIITDGIKRFDFGEAYNLRDTNGPVLLVGCGIGTTRALDAAIILEKDGIECSLLHMPTIKPLDVDCLIKLASQARLVVTVEEHTVIGGLGSAVTDAIVEYLDDARPSIRRIGLPDAFPDDYGDQDYLMKKYGVYPEEIAVQVKAALSSIMTM